MSDNRSKLAVAFIAVALVAGCGGNDSSDGAAARPTETAAPPSEPQGSSALTEQIDSLSVEAERPDGYDRDLFGDYDRDELLAANAETHEDRCDGEYLSVADDTCGASGDVHIDHVVALSEAWASGASEWGEQRLSEFASDPAGLIVMTAGLNMSKGDGDPAEWMPPHEAYRCDYVDTYVSVKVDYELSVDEAERDALVAAAEGCE